MSSFGHPLPGQIIFRFIGFPESDDERLISWTSNRLAFTWGQPSEDEQVDIAENMLRYWRYCREFVASRKLERADDLTLNYSTPTILIRTNSPTLRLSPSSTDCPSQDTKSSATT